MPNLSFKLQDLISRILTVNVHDRITMEELKQHPAFLLGLPEGYKVPKPLPLPYNIGPIDPETVDQSLISILRSIGYSSDKDIYDEFRSETTTKAKIFYLMYNRLVSLQSIPWPDSNIDSSVPEELFMMTPRQVVMMSPPGGNDEFGRRNKIPHEMQSPDSVVQSLARPVDWSSIPLLKPEEEDGNQIEQTFSDIPGPLEVVVTGLQKAFQGVYDYVYPNDMEFIIRRAPNLFTILTFEYQSADMLSAIALKISGSSDDFTEFVTDITKTFKEIIANNS